MCKVCTENVKGLENIIRSNLSEIGLSQSLEWLQDRERLESGIVLERCGNRCGQSPGSTILTITEHVGYLEVHLEDMNCQ